MLASKHRMLEATHSKCVPEAERAVEDKADAEAAQQQAKALLEMRMQELNDVRAAMANVQVVCRRIICPSARHAAQTA